MTNWEEWKDAAALCQSQTNTAIAGCVTSSNEVDAKKLSCETFFTGASNDLCSFTSSVQTREEHMGSLNVSMLEALTVLTTPTDRKKDFLSLQTIICVFQTFHDRQAMNFETDDYTNCVKKTKDDVFPSPPTIPARPSTMSIDNIQFGGGLADKYKGVAPAVSGLQVTLRVHLYGTQQSKLFLKLPAPDDEKLVCEGGAFKSNFVR